MAVIMFKFGDKLTHGGGWVSPIVWTCSKYAILAPEDGTFGVIQRDPAAPDGWDVLHNSEGDYVEFSALEEAIVFATKRLEDENDAYDSCPWVEDETGAEPPFDFCSSCGKVRY